MLFVSVFNALAVGDHDDDDEQNPPRGHNVLDTLPQVARVILYVAQTRLTLPRPLITQSFPTGEKRLKTEPLRLLICILLR